MPTSKKVEKINDDDIVIPTSNNYELILHYNYNKDQLKKFLKHIFSIFGFIQI
jgi:hypothetical protein